MASPAASGKLQKPIPIPYGGRTASGQFPAVSPTRGGNRSPSAQIPSRGSPVRRRRNYSNQTSAYPVLPPSHAGLNPTLAADDGILLPPPPIGAQFNPRRSSLDWSSRPTTPVSTNSRSTSPVNPGGYVHYSTPNFAPPVPEHSTPRLAPPTPERLAPIASEEKEKKNRRSWFGRNKDKSEEDKGPQAWIVGHHGMVPFDLAGLLSGNAMPELWNPSGDCFVHLFPRDSGKGPSFRVDSSIFASSPVLTKLAYGDVYGSQTSTAGASDRTSLVEATDRLNIQTSTPPMTPEQKARYAPSDISRDSRFMLDAYDTPSEVHLYLPVQQSAESIQLSPKGRVLAQSIHEAEALIAVRNLFAFLTGQALVATEKRFSVFAVFMRISELLKIYEFSNLDESTYGEVATSSFDKYVDELGLADVRLSLEQTIEGIVLGEHMRSVALYNEAFTHAVGKHDDILKLNNPKFKLLSPITVNRLGRAAMDLDKRTASVQHTLEDFDFPGIFSGIMASKTADERKLVDFDAWKDSFFSMRKFFMAFYKTRYGSWPPKASSKKNDLETSGLNRIVLQDLYNDLSSLYDLLVDRTSLTNRTADGVLMDDRDTDSPYVSALRHVLSEYDRSSPPVKPPVPFDLPTFPSLRSTRPDFGTSDQKKDAKTLGKKLKDDEIAAILRASYNQDVPISQFLAAYREVERKAAHSCTIQAIVDARIGHWIFMYAVLQALPMLVVDAPDLKHTDGVEYFLCEPPRSGVPWAKEDALGTRNWYEISGGGVVSLPSDVVENSVEGIYRRSHCWVAAQNWTRGNPIVAAAIEEQTRGTDMAMGPAGLQPPENFTRPPRSSSLRPGSRDTSPNKSPRSKRESVMHLGLEALPLPVGVRPDGGLVAPGGAPLVGGVRPPSRNATDPARTFDDILKSAEVEQGKKKR